MEIALHREKCEPVAEAQPNGTIRIHADIHSSLENLLQKLSELGAEHRRELEQLWADESIERRFEDHVDFVLVKRK
jgi:hypothetical protein